MTHECDLNYSKTSYKTVTIEKKDGRWHAVIKTSIKTSSCSSWSTAVKEKFQVNHCPFCGIDLELMERLLND